MENGDAIAEDVKLGETNAVSSEVSLKENFDSSLDGLKDSDGDEEAVEAESGTVGSEYSTVAEDGNAELSGTLGNDNKDKEVNSELFQEAHKFEEVAGVPVRWVPVRAVPEDARDESKILTSDDNQLGVGKVASDKTNGSEYGTMVIDENAELSGTLENNNNDKTVNSDLFQEAHMFEDMIGTLGVVPEDATAKSKILTSDDKQIGVEKVVSDETNGSTDDGIAEHLNGGYEKSDDSDRMPEDDNISGLTSGGAKIPGKDTIEEPIVEISEALAPKDDAKAFPHELLTETQDDDICSDIPETGSLDHMNLAAVAMKVQIHKTAQEFEGEQNGTQESEPDFNSQNSNSGYEIDSANLHSESNDHEEDYSTSYAEPNDIGNTDMKKLELESVQAVKIESQVADMEENSGIPAPGASATDDLEESSGLNTNSHPVLEDSTSNLEKAGVEPQVSSSESLPESSSSSTQPEVPINIIKREEQEGVKNEKKEQYLSGNSEQDVTLVTGQDVTPVTERGVTPVTASGHAAKVQEPVSQYTSPNDGKQEFKVYNSVTTQPVRVTQRSETTPLPEPASQIKERGSNITTSLTPNRPAGLGRATALPEPTSRVAHQQPRVNGAVSAPQNQLIEDPMSSDAEEYDETREKLQMIRVKFLRLARRLGQTPHNVVVAQVLYRLGLAEQLHGRSGGRVGAFSFDRASAMAEQLEAVGQEPLDFSCTIMVIGKSGVGKSATINSIFDEAMFVTDAFQSSTTKVQDIVGTVQGIRVRVIDTPGLLPSWSDQGQNEKILRSVKNFIRKMPPDIVLYLDRLDMQNRDSGDTPLLRTITEIFEPSIWFNAIVVLTHAASAPPEGPNGTATSYDMFVTQRSHVVQQAIRQAAGDMRLMNPVSLVENHSACRTNRAGQRVLPNGQVWKPHLLLLSFASKILAEANTLLKLQDTTPPGRSFAPRTRSPPLPFLLSSLLQSRPEIKLPSVQFGGDDDEDGNVDDDLDGDLDPEEESEYDELPPFKSLTKAQLEILSKAQRKAYYDELEYREKLFMKKQLREERKRRKLMQKLQEVAKDLPVDYIGDNNSEEETGGAASVPVPMPDLALPASFDSDNPTHRYRSLDSSNQWLVRAVMEPNGWDHDIGYDGINIERLFVAKEKIPISFSGHISKDKKDASLQMEVASSVKHGKGKATQLGFDMQPLGKDYAYTLRSETRFINHRISKAAVGISATVLGDVITGGVKLEDKLTIGKRGQIVVSGGAIYGRGEAAYGGSLEATLRDKEHPLGRFLTTLGLSVMDWHGELAVGCNSQTQIPIGRNTNLIGRVNVNNRGSGQVSVKVNSSEQLQIVLIGLIPLVKKVLGYYSPQAQYG